MPDERAPWYRDGLRFGCTRCGHCCGGDSGTVAVSDAEIATLARRFDVTPAQLRAMYTDPLEGGGHTLRERPNGDCIFYARERGCTVYEDRPRQCRTWPFWRRVVRTPARWAEEAYGCPGMNQGPLIDAQTVLALSRDDGTARRGRG